MSSKKSEEEENSLESKEAIMGPKKPTYAYNKFRRCLNIFKWFPVLFILSMLSWGYYAYTIQLCLFTIETVIIKILCLLVFHLFIIMTLWSYFKTIFVKPGQVPRPFWFTQSDYERFMLEMQEESRNEILKNIVNDRQLPILCRTFSGAYRICEKCNLIKPDRSHHCAVCGCCILKMDHHCPWVNNCVSFTNYKFFVLFLGYAFSLCLFTASTTFYYFLRSWKNEISTMARFHILFLFFVSIMFAISLASLFLYHCYLVLVNRSTLESFRPPIFRFGPDKNAFNLGKYKNWCEVFGTSKLKWLIPVSTSNGDGYVYPLNKRLSQIIENSNRDNELTMSGVLVEDSNVMTNLADERISNSATEPIMKSSNNQYTNVNTYNSFHVVNISGDNSSITSPTVALSKQENIDNQTT